MKLFLLFAVAYLAGSVNFPILLLKWFKKADPRESFSKNPGMFNVYRQHGFYWALLILLLDMGRSVAVAYAASFFLPISTIPWIGFGLIIGNCFPCFHRFRGGKGVANYLGFTAFLAWPWALAAMGVWLACYAVSRIAFIGSLTMVLILAAGTLKTCP